MSPKDTSFLLLLRKAEQYLENLYTFQQMMKKSVVLYTFIPGISECFANISVSSW